MRDWVRAAAWIVVSALKSRLDLALENVSLSHQMMVLQRQSGTSHELSSPSILTPSHPEIQQ